jgi:hypothetical protein
MSVKDFKGFHQDLAELMIAEVQPHSGEFTPEDFDRLARLALGAVAPEMLASYLAVSAADARDRALATMMP